MKSEPERSRVKTSTSAEDRPPVVTLQALLQIALLRIGARATAPELVTKVATPPTAAPFRNLRRSTPLLLDFFRGRLSRRESFSSVSFFPCAQQSQRFRCINLHGLFGFAVGKIRSTLRIDGCDPCGKDGAPETNQTSQQLAIVIPASSSSVKTPTLDRTGIADSTTLRTVAAR